MEKCIYIVLFLLGSLVLGSCEDDCSAVAEGDNQKNVIQLSIVGMQDVQVRGIASEWQNEISFYTLFVYRGDNLKSTPVYYQDGNSRAILGNSTASPLLKFTDDFTPQTNDRVYVLLNASVGNSSISEEDLQKAKVSPIQGLSDSGNFYMCFSGSLVWKENASNLCVMDRRMAAVRVNLSSGINKTINKIVCYNEPRYISLFNGDDIYVAGTTTESTVIWKNGKQLLEFPDKSGKGIIIIDNNDIYLSTGKSVTVQTSSNSSHGFWVGVVYKNDQLLYQLTESTASQIESMYLYNGDIYTCGCSENYAKVWVNGKPIDTNNITGMFSSIFVSENKIYALYDDLVSGSFTPMLFCDGNSIKLNKEYGGAMNIVVKDGNEYICCERAVLKNRSIVVSRTGYEVIYSMFVI